MEKSDEQMLHRACFSVLGDGIMQGHLPVYSCLKVCFFFEPDDAILNEAIDIFACEAM